MEEVSFFIFRICKFLDFNQRENDSCLRLWVRCDAFQIIRVTGFPSCFTYRLKKAAELH